MPPTSLLRSRPPTPMACEIPPPYWPIRQDTSWMPVPDAPTRPMSPRDTTLANASGTPPDDRRAAVGAHNQTAKLRSFTLELRFVCQADVVAKKHDIEPLPDRLTCFSNGEGSRYRNQGKIGVRSGFDCRLQISRSPGCSFIAIRCRTIQLCLSFGKRRLRRLVRCRTDCQ